jgi:hypothetical protein
MTTRLFLLAATLASATAFLPVPPSHDGLRRKARHYSTVTDQSIQNWIEKGDIDAAIRAVQETESSIPGALGAKILNAAATMESSIESSSGTTVSEENTFRDPIGGGVYSASKLVGSAAVAAGSNTKSRPASPIQEQRLVQCYTLFNTKVQGAAGLFASQDVRKDLALASGSGCSIEQLERFTELPIRAFRPSPTTARLYWLGGAGACLLELGLAQVLQISPQPLFLATFAFVLADQTLGGAWSEKVLWTLFPEIGERVLRHEAGHLLVAHLLGCPVQSLALGSWDALFKDTAGGGLSGAGTSFFDPELNAASIKGRVTRSVVDRFSIIVMAGIAAEALCFGEAEGGSDDEESLTVFLSQTIQSNQNIPEQARWAATNALTLLKEHRDVYDRLVTALQMNGSADIGKIMMAVEGVEA